MVKVKVKKLTAKERMEALHQNSVDPEAKHFKGIGCFFGRYPPLREDDIWTWWHIAKELFFANLRAKEASEPHGRMGEFHKPFWKFMNLQAASIVLQPSNLHMTLLKAAAKNWAELTYRETDLAVAQMMDLQKSHANPLFRARARGFVMDSEQLGRIAEQLMLDDPIPRWRRPLWGK